MNPSQPQSSFGSGGPLLGAPASQILAQPGGLSQQSPSSPGFNPALFPRSPLDQMQPMNQTQNPGQPMQPQMPPPPMQPQAPQASGVVGLPPQQTEAEMIIKALSNRLASHSKIGEALHIPQPLGR